MPQEQRKQIKNIFKVYKNLLPDEAEKNLVHADFDPANILVSEVNGKIEVSGILDWEFSLLAPLCVMLPLCLDTLNARHYQDSFLKGCVEVVMNYPALGTLQ